MGGGGFTHADEAGGGLLSYRMTNTPPYALCIRPTSVLEVVLAMSAAAGKLKLNLLNVSVHCSPYRPFLSANITSLSLSLYNMRGDDLLTALQRYTPIKNGKRERENHVKGKVSLPLV